MGADDTDDDDKTENGNKKKVNARLMITNRNTLCSTWVWMQTWTRVNWVMGITTQNSPIVVFPIFIYLFLFFSLVNIGDMINMTTKYMHELNLMFSCMEVGIFLLWCVLCHAYVVLFQLIYPSSDNGIGILCCSRGEII